MIPDWQTNCVFLADRLESRFPALFKALQKILHSHGIEVRICQKVKDIWVRDYAPVQVSDRHFVKFIYNPSYLRRHRHLITGASVVRSFQELGRCSRSQITLDGGNIVATKTVAILTDQIYRENPTWNRSELREEIRRQLEVDQLIVVPKEPYDPIGHTDAMVRFLDEKTVLVNDYAKVHAEFGEQLGKVLRRNRLDIETLPYFFEKRTRDGIPSAAGCYINFLRTEKLVIFPVFRTACDHAALKKLESVFPGIPLVAVDCLDLAREGGVLNCISATIRLQAIDPRQRTIKRNRPT